MKTLSLALRNLLRNRRRSLTTLLAMVVGVVTVLLFGGYSRSITYGLQTIFVLRGGHLQIQHRDFFVYGSGNPAAYGIADYSRLIEVVRQDPQLAPLLTVVTPSITLGGIAGNFDAGVSRTVMGTGMVVADRMRMREWNDYGLAITLSPYALQGTAEDAVVIGTGVARVLELCGPLHVAACLRHALPAGADKGAGAADANHAPDATLTTPAAPAAALPPDVGALAEQEAQAARNGKGQGTVAGDPAQDGAPRIELLAANVHGAPNVATLRVVKAERQGVKELDDVYIGMHLAQAQRLLYGGETPRVTAILVQLRHTSDIPAAQARIAELLATRFAGAPLEVQDFATLNPFYGQVIGLFAAIFGFMAVLIGAIVLFTIANTMSTAVMERTAEIGTLRAIGLRRAGIRRLFVCEGLLMGIFGALLGVALALAMAVLVNHAGLTWLPPGQSDRVPLTVRVWGEWRMMLGTAGALMLLSVISAWWPARRAARMVIVDALRHV